MNEFPTYVVIPVKNQLAYTQGIVTQLLEQGEVERIFVLDNGSTDGTLEWLKKTQEGRENLIGVSTMPHVQQATSIHVLWNEGLIESEFDAQMLKVPRWNVAILNNDLRIGPSFLSTLAHILRLDPSVGIVGPNYDGRHFLLPTQPVTQICANRYDGTGGLPGFAFMLKGEEGYRFPEDLTWWCGDNDLLLTILSRGRSALLVRDATCEHLDGGGRTGKWDDPEVREVCQKDIATFRAKWGLRST